MKKTVPKVMRGVRQGKAPPAPTRGVQETLLAQPEAAPELVLPAAEETAAAKPAEKPAEKSSAEKSAEKPAEKEVPVKPQAVRKQDAYRHPQRVWPD